MMQKLCALGMHSAIRRNHLKDASFYVNHNQQPKPLLLLISVSHPNLQYIADFAPELGLIIMETKYLEQLGFQVPELARNVALQVCNETTNFVSFSFSHPSSKGNSIVKADSSSNKRITQEALWHGSPALTLERMLEESKIMKG